MAKSSRQSNQTSEFSADMRICVLYGPETMLQNEALDQIRDLMIKAHKDVQTLVFNGAETELATVFDELRSYSLMQQYKIVIVDQADQFVTRHRAALERYVKAPVDHATLILRGSKWNRGNLDKAIARVGCLVKCQSLTASQATDWLVRKARQTHQTSLDRKVASMLVQRLGCDLMKLNAELGKLVLFASEGRPIDLRMIDEIVGKSSEQQAWAVQEAILEAMANTGSLRPSRGGDALEKIHELVDLSNQPDVLVMYFVADLVRKFYVATQMRDQGEATAGIARHLKLWGPRQNLFMKVLNRLSSARAGRMLDDAVRADARAKSGFGMPMRNLECFCMMMVDNIQ